MDDEPTVTEVTEEDIAPPLVWVHLIVLPAPGWVLADVAEEGDGRT